MRIALLSYPMLFQRQGGLQVQVLETMAALRARGEDAALFDWRSEHLGDFDIIHVFGAINGNQRIVQAAVAANVPVVLSTVLHPPFPSRTRRLAALCDALLGRLTGWSVQTSVRQIREALDGADAVVALGGLEREMLADGYAVDPGKISVIPNGIDARFFSAGPGEFRRRFDLHPPIVACVASVSPYKNQLGLIRALADADLRIVLAGTCLRENKAYLDECLRAGEGRVSYLGALDHRDPLLPSIYAASDVYVLPSVSEVMPLGVLEALAANTPAVVTRNSSLDLASQPGILAQVDHADMTAIRVAVQGMIETSRKPGDSSCRDYVADFTWDRVAKMLIDVYRRVRGA